MQSFFSKNRITDTQPVGYQRSTDKRQVQGSVNDTNERHPAFDLSFNDNTVKATMMGWGKATPQD
jgi:hypothetical protein